MIERDGSRPEQEHLLRQNIVLKLNDLSLLQPSLVANLLGQHQPLIGLSELLEQFNNTINTAKRGNHWGKENEVTIGYYSSPSTYNTLLMHEASHKVLDFFLDDPINHSEEEVLCYQMSRKLCELLNLPYDDKIEQIALEFNNIAKESNSDQQIISLDASFEAFILGFSGRDNCPNFYWNIENQPVIED